MEAPVRHGGSARLKACSRYYLMPAAERSEFDRYSLVYARGGWGRRGDQKLQAGVGLGEVLLYARGNRRLIRDGEPRTATSTFTHLLGSVLQCCFTATETIQYKLLGTGAQDVHLDCHLTLELCSSMLLYGHRNYTVQTIRDGSPGRPPRLSPNS